MAEKKHYAIKVEAIEDPKGAYVAEDPKAVEDMAWDGIDYVCENWLDEYDVEIG